MSVHRPLTALVVGLVLVAAPAAPAAAQHLHEGAVSSSSGILPGLGDHGWRIRTASPDAQAFFDQGLRLYYAFNHEEAIRSFQRAQQLDPGCAMCAWGEALALGPNINLPMTDGAAASAAAAIERAVDLDDGGDAMETTLIAALSRRYDASVGDRHAQDRAWAEGLALLSDRYPAQDEILVLWGEAVMTMRPWDYWDEAGQPRAGIAEALGRFEDVVRRDPNHPGACHFYIHAVEKLYPERGVPCAERLASLMPGAGHIVHMPGHIYIRVGRYNDAIRANEHAVHADETYIQDVRPGLGVYTAGYYPHNYDFLAFAASMVGRDEQAIDAAKKVRENTPTPMLESGAVPFLQSFVARPYQLLVRFGRWSEVLREPAPSADLVYTTVIYHYARGRAFLGLGDRGSAVGELDALRGAIASPDLQGLYMEFNSAADLAGIAEALLDGWVKIANDDSSGLNRLRDAVRMQDALLYGEPPEWTVSARHDLGFALLDAGRIAEAEEVYRADLDAFPENGWALKGLELTLARQDRTAESASVRRRFERAWVEATLKIDGSVVAPLKR